MARDSGLTTIILLGGAGFAAWKLGLLAKLLPGTVPPPGGSCAGATENAAALRIANAPVRADICQNITNWSAGQYNCTTDANKIALVKHWWYQLNPPEKAQYGTLCAYATALGV